MCFNRDLDPDPGSESGLRFLPGSGSGLKRIRIRSTYMHVYLCDALSSRILESGVSSSYLFPRRTRTRVYSLLLICLYFTIFRARRSVPVEFLETVETSHHQPHQRRGGATSHHHQIHLEEEEGVAGETVLLDPVSHLSLVFTSVQVPTYCCTCTQG